MIKVMKVEPLHGGAFAGGNRLARLKEEELKANEDSASANSTSADEERSADEEGHDDDLSQWSQASLGSKVNDDASDEGEDDENYNSAIREEINVGPNHQAEIPSLLNGDAQAFESASAEVGANQYVWRPGRLSDAAVNSYLEHATRVVEDAVVHLNMSGCKDKAVVLGSDRFLATLHGQGYDAKKALAVVEATPLEYVKRWKVQEANVMEDALRKAGDDLAGAMRAISGALGEKESAGIDSHKLAEYYFLFRHSKASRKTGSASSPRMRLPSFAEDDSQTQNVRRSARQRTTRKRKRGETKLNRRQRAENFLHFACRELALKDYQQVISILQRFDKGGVEAPALVRQVVRLCSTSAVLLCEFSQFVPRKYRCLVRPPAPVS
mmetsp:Transcript_35199/g.110823  ORF Transcript_35199/g.110823 Transcript_35199/m.110823 type:complete len:382 (+) Transcript_35199:131-1276(+)